jgi:hypothetical protein
MNKFVPAYNNPNVEIAPYLKKNKIARLCAVVINPITGTTLFLGGRG